jgi:hypothetical protein
VALNALLSAYLANSLASIGTLGNFESKLALKIYLDNDHSK